MPVHLQKELSGDGRIQRHLTEQHFYFDVLGGQSQLVCPHVPHGEEMGRVRVHLDANLHFAEMKHLDQGFEAQDVGGSTHVLGVLGFHLAHEVLDIQGQGGKIVVGHIHLVGRLGRGGIDPIETPLGSQNRLSIVSVVVEDGFQVAFVSVRVGLGTDQGVVEMDTDLFEEGMRQIVDQRDGISVHQVASHRFLEGQFHLEEAAGQIDKVHLGIDLKFHGIDVCREGADGEVAGAHDAQMGGWNGEQIQHGIDNPHGTRQGLIVVGVFFLTLLASVANGSWATVVLQRRWYLLFVLSFGSIGVRRCLLVANSSFAAADDARVGNRWDSPKMSVSFRLASRLMVSKALRFTARLAPLFTPQMARGMLGNPSTPPVLRPCQPDRTDSCTKSLKKPPPPWVGVGSGR